MSAKLQLSCKNALQIYKIIDFIIETRKRQHGSKAHIVCLEVKLAENWDRRSERPMRSLSTHENINVDKMAGIYTGKRAVRRNILRFLEGFMFELSREEYQLLRSQSGTLKRGTNYRIKPRKDTKEDS